LEVNQPVKETCRNAYVAPRKDSLDDLYSLAQAASRVLKSKTGRNCMWSQQKPLYCVLLHLL